MYAQAIYLWNLINVRTNIFIHCIFYEIYLRNLKAYPQRQLFSSWFQLRRVTNRDPLNGKSMFNWHTWPETIFNRIVERLVIAIGWPSVYRRRVWPLPINHAHQIKFKKNIHRSYRSWTIELNFEGLIATPCYRYLLLTIALETVELDHVESDTS